MAVDYRFKKGTDLPSWHWLSPFMQGSSNHGTSNAYDGSRYMYWAVQYGTTATTASTAQLWRFDTWNNGWQFLATLTSGNMGIDLEYDAIRNLVYITTGSGLTSWQVFNLNATAVTVFNQSMPAWTLTTVTTVLPAVASYGASLTMPDDTSTPSPIDTLSAGTGSTTTSLVASTGRFGPGVVGNQIRFTSGPLSGQRRIISVWTSANTVTVAPAFSAAPAANDTFVMELPENTATGGTTTTLVTPGTLATNLYANSDVIITGGTGNGQRRRVASNDATTLTISAAVTGNPRTGPFSPAPDATSTYRIVPSSDFLYFQPGNASTALWRIDAVQTTGSAWTSLAVAPGGISGGGNTMYPQAYSPFSIIAVRGAGTANYYHYGIGTNVWTTPTVFMGQETFTTGASAAMMHGKRKIFIQKESSARCYALDLTTGMLEPAGVMPYANPGGYDGHRARFVKTLDGVEWIYLMRSGGQEFYRVPIEWL